VSPVTPVTDADFEQEVKQSDKLVLVDFWAEWCGPCRRVGPLVEELANEYGDKLKVCKVDVESSPDTAGEYGIMSIPALLLFKDGELVDQRVGFSPKEALKSWVDENL
jgi:thioredoxin 1